MVRALGRSVRGFAYRWTLAWVLMVLVVAVYATITARQTDYKFHQFTVGLCGAIADSKTATRADIALKRYQADSARIRQQSDAKLGLAAQSDRDGHAASLYDAQADRAQKSLTADYSFLGC